MADVLRFRRAATGELEEITAQVDDVESPAGEYLTARTVWLQDGSPDGLELSQHRPVPGDRRQEGYLRLDNEILVGRRLHELAGWSGYPSELARLYGDEPTSAEPFALFEPDRGEPLREVGAYLLSDAFDQFLVGLLTGLCWLAAGGVVHRGISPDTVLWDSDSGTIHIVDFSRSAPFGGIRTPVAGSWAWVPPESRPDTCYGLVGPTDDTWAAAKLIYFVHSRGKDLQNVGELAGHGGLSQIFNGMLEKVFGPPEGRPTARDLVEYGLRRRHILPSLQDNGRRLIRGRQSFLNARARAHPDAPLPPDFWNDVLWALGQREAAGTQGGGAG